MILIAVEEKGYVYAYDDGKNTILSVAGKLYNYTSTTVAVKKNNANIIDIYDAEGKIICTYPYDVCDLSNINGIAI